MVTNRTNKENVVEFLKKLKAETTQDINEVIIYTDNHSSHRSKHVKTWLRENNVTMDFLPVYSSVLSPVERIWSIFKVKWGKFLSQKVVKYRKEDI